MTHGLGLVYVVDDDRAVLEGLDSLLRSVGFDVRCARSSRELSVQPRPDHPCCIVLDVRMPRQSGLDFQAELTRNAVTIPVIFLTGHGDVPMCAQAMRGGAVDFLLKPFREQDLLNAIETALRLDQQRLADAATRCELQTRLDTLTSRERQVMALVVTGRLNKQIAGDLGLSEIAIKVNRGHVMRKMMAASLADLVRMFDYLHSSTYVDK